MGIVIKNMDKKIFILNMLQKSPSTHNISISLYSYGGLIMEIELMEKQLKAVADANRLRILACLKKGEVCVCDFTDVLGISQPAVSQHLRKLKDAGIITERKVGTWKHYRIHENQTTLMQSILASIDEELTCGCKIDCECVEG